jgi:hypothetical protein
VATPKGEEGSEARPYDIVHDAMRYANESGKFEL